jgi:predicted acyltransferase
MTIRAPRRVAFDVVRGITIAAMLVVNDPGDATHVYGTLRHSRWHGCTLADLVFPAFLLLVGVTTQLAANASREQATTTRIWRRAALLFGIGLLLNAYPFFEKNAVAGPGMLPLFLQHIGARLASLRLLGVLQRIGLVYLAVVWPARHASLRTLLLVIAALLLGYWLLLTQIPVPGVGGPPSSLDVPLQTLPVWLDHTLLDWQALGLGWHLWDRAVDFEPEGVLSTVPAIATALLGVVLARLLTRVPTSLSTVRQVSAWALAMIAVGGVWSLVLPLNKPLWTSSYVLLTGGITWLLCAACLWALELRHWRRWCEPLIVLGSNSIAVYVFAEFTASVFRSSIKWRVGERRVGSGEALVRLLEPLGVDPRAGSLAWALLFSLWCYLFARALHRRQLFLRL